MQKRKGMADLFVGIAQQVMILTLDLALFAKAPSIYPT